MVAGFAASTNHWRAFSLIRIKVKRKCQAPPDDAQRQLGLTETEAKRLLGRFVFWSILASLIVVVTILLTVDEASALFQITAPPLPVLVLTILGSLAAGGWFGFAKILASLLPCTSRKSDQTRYAGNPT